MFGFVKKNLLTVAAVGTSLVAVASSAFAEGNSTISGVPSIDLSPSDVVTEIGSVVGPWIIAGVTIAIMFIGIAMGWRYFKRLGK